ncbi:transcriptional regulator, LysR family [Rhodococcus wratislaviensis]|uniref:Transcriptional regulator, LysR family n=1 Tax=Rhodococcus wratislaviensis TaxID=44752 RepID=A0A402C2Q6_RHOWR|nr:transcriptional regulator, LysR family [Rhodococcus wratislaviensis]
MNVEHTTIRRRIIALEKSVGSRLFDKTVNGWVLTLSGQRLLPYAQRIESEAETAQAALKDEEHNLKGTVRIVATDGLGSRVIAPSLAALRQKHPSIEVDLVTTSHLLDYTVGEFDLAVTIGDRPERRGFRQTHLCDYQLRLYASPGYLDSHAPITSLSDLAEHNLIWFVESLLQLPELRDSQNEEISAHANIVFRTTNIFAQLEAAASGGGLGLLPCFLAHSDPRLLPVLHNEVHPQRNYTMVVPSRLLNAELVTTVASHLFSDTQRRHELFIPPMPEV